jgi:uncharacterized membrane protein YqjE
MVPVKYEPYDTRAMVKIVVVILLGMVETILGILLLHRLVIFWGFDETSAGDFDAMLPFVVACFLAIGVVLWTLRQPNEQNKT